MATEQERIAVLETQYADMHADVHEIKADVKLLLSYHNERRGAMAATKYIGHGFIGLITFLAGLFFGTGGR